MRLYRQGDIVIRQIPRLPSGVERQVSAILAYGERTGHTHRLDGRGQVWRQDTRLYLKLEQPSRVVHDEHGPVTLPPGVYEVVGQREYVSSEEDRRVFD
jgi:hypothetical protein